MCSFGFFGRAINSGCLICYPTSRDYVSKKYMSARNSRSYRTLYQRERQQWFEKAGFSYFEFIEDLPVDHGIFIATK